jgi:hypothetical protein
MHAPPPAAAAAAAAIGGWRGVGVQAPTHCALLRARVHAGGARRAGGARQGPSAFHVWSGASGLPFDRYYATPVLVTRLRRLTHGGVRRRYPPCCWACAAAGAHGGAAPARWRAAHARCVRPMHATTTVHGLLRPCGRAALTTQVLPTHTWREPPRCCWRRRRRRSAAAKLMAGRSCATRTHTQVSMSDSRCASCMLRRGAARRAAGGARAGPCAGAGQGRGGEGEAGGGAAGRRRAAQVLRILHDKNRR